MSNSVRDNEGQRKATDTRSTNTNTSAKADPKGARSLQGGPVRKAPLGWLPWVALLLLGLVGLGALLVARNVGDAGDAPGVDLTDEASASGQDPAGPDANANDGKDAGGQADTTTTAPRSTTTAPRSTSTAPVTPPAAAGAASLRAGNTAILPLPAAGLASLTGQPVEGLNVNVQSVVGNESFWVGNDTTNRALVYLSPQARNTAGESPFQVLAGQKIKVTGSLKPLPADVTPFGVDASEGSDQLKQQGQYIEATSIALS